MPAQARFVLISALLLLVLTVFNAAAAPAVTPELQRAEVLSGLATVGLMLVAVLWTRANPRSAEAQPLEGSQGLFIEAQLSAQQQEELGWGTHMLLTATPAATVLVFWRGQVVLRRGLICEASFEPGPICLRVMDRQQTVSLVNTSLFPGRSEFDAVLQQLPAVLISPIGAEGVVVLGGWSARCFSRSDERWLEGWSQRLKTTLQENASLGTTQPDPDSV